MGIGRVRICMAANSAGEGSSPKTLDERSNISAFTSRTSANASSIGPACAVRVVVAKIEIVRITRNEVVQRFIGSPVKGKMEFCPEGSQYYF